MGVTGYYLFGSKTSGDLLRNLGGPEVLGVRGTYERALKLCYGLSILGSIPMMIQPFYPVLLPLFDQWGSGPEGEGGAGPTVKGR